MVRGQKHSSRSGPLDEAAVARAIQGIGDREQLLRAARVISLVAEPGRLALLLGMRAAGSIAVSDLAIATGMSDTSVSQALRRLKDGGLVSGSRHGRVIRYRICTGTPEASLLICLLEKVPSG